VVVLAADVVVFVGSVFDFSYGLFTSEHDTVDTNYVIGSINASAFSLLCSFI
jgi:hypothetical protein